MADTASDLMDLLKRADPAGRVDVVRRFLSDVELVGSLCRLFCTQSTRLSSFADEALKKLGPEAVEPLAHALRTGRPTVQRYAAVGLWMLRDPACLPPLLEALESPHVEVRRRAVQGLWVFEDPAAVEPLIRHLQHDPDLEVATSAAGELGHLRDRRAVEPLLRALEQRAWRLRQAAAFALGDIGDENALPALRRHLSDSKPQVRDSVKSALSSFHFRRLQRE